MGERLTAREQKTRTPETVIGEIVEHFERAGHPLSPEVLSRLIGSIRTVDLGRSQLALELGRTPLATLNSRELDLDIGFRELSPSQQRHVILHEYGHSFYRLLGKDEEDSAQMMRLQKVTQRLGQFQAVEVSPYISYLESTLEANDNNRARIQEEKIAETFAQYWASDRTFSGFMTAKLLEFDTSDAPEHYDEFASVITEVRDLGIYLDTVDNDEEREAFLQHHPQLRQQFELWQDMDQLFNELDLESIIEEEDDELPDDLLWDDYELGANILPEPTVNAAQPRTIFAPSENSSEPPPPFAHIINFWKIFS